MGPRLMIVALAFTSLAGPGLVEPARAQECGGVGKAEFVCLSANAEDLVAVPNSDWVIASGELRAINTHSHAEVTLFSPEAQLDKELYGSCPGPLGGAEMEKMGFRAHGINVRAGAGGVHTLYIIHHGSRESVEVFRLDAQGGTPAVRWIGCAISPPGVSGNSVAVLPENGFAITNFLSRDLGTWRGDMGAAVRAKMARGEATGEVWEWSPAVGWKLVPGSEGSGPNGIEASQDGKWLYIAEWATQRIVKLSRGQMPIRKEEVRLDFHPDNLRWQEDGSLIAGGQHGTIDAVLSDCLTNGNCNGVSTTIARIDPRTLESRELVSRYPTNDFFAAGTMGLIVGKEIWVGSTYRGKRIARFTLPQSRPRS